VDTAVLPGAAILLDFIRKTEVERINLNRNPAKTAFSQPRAAHTGNENSLFQYKDHRSFC
jgi:hypothetical protein